MSEEKAKSRNKGNFVGGYITDTHLQKIEEVEKLFDEQFGDVGRNRTRALRFIIDSFNTEWLSEFPKSLASKGMNA